MSKFNLSAIHIIIVLFMLSLCSCDFRYGFIESEFNLSTESRLPKWVDIPSGYLRKDLTMTITFYTHPFFKKVKMIVRAPAPDHKVIMEIIGNQRYHPLTEEQPRDTYPGYIVISVKGIEEVFEQRERSPVLYITDDPKVTCFLKNR